MLLGTIALGVALVSGDTAKAAPATWTIDPVHSELSFRVRHLNGRVRGAFKEWGGTVSVDPDQLIGGSARWSNAPVIARRGPQAPTRQSRCVGTGSPCWTSRACHVARYARSSQ